MSDPMTKDERNTMLWVIGGIVLSVLFAYISVLGQSAENGLISIYTIVYFSWAVLFILVKKVDNRNKERKAAGLKLWTRVEMDELEERVRKLEEKE